MTKTFRIAIDVGGTFTDVVIVNDVDGSLRFAKVLSTAQDPSLGSLEGAQQCLQRNGLVASDVSEVIHATTVATNAVLERNGSVTGLITTRGFRDTLEIRRESRYDIYDFNLQLHEPLVPRNLRFEVDERLDHEGNVVVALDESGIQFIVDKLLENKVSAIAICLLHSHVNPIHERRLVELLKEMAPGIEISVSH